jgi:hypothetical protein
MESTCHILTDQEAAHAAVDARVAALRWDLVPWSLVLDCDAGQSSLARLWIVFEGLDTVTLPCDDARIPNGIWIAGEIGIEPGMDGLSDFSFLALLPRHDERGDVTGRPSRLATIRARRMLGVRSTGGAPPGPYDSLARMERLALASDDQMLAAIAAVDPGGSAG